MPNNKKLRWMRLDNAAKIYPAARRQNWSNIFRLSATLTEAVDTAALQRALDITVKRFPSIAVRLRRGAFWYYLQQLEHAPALQEESSYPLTRMSRKEIRKCAIRVIVYGNRIALEFFHSVTDGNGALSFLKTLLAQYLQARYGICVPAQMGVFDCLEEPKAEELEDSFQKYGGSVGASRKETDAFHLTGTPEPDGFLHVTCLQVPVAPALEKAHSYGVSLTAYLNAAMMMALQQLQAEYVPNRKHRKHIKVLIPVNLRNLFPSNTLRNFAMYTTPELDPRLGDYTFAEICKVVHHHMGLDITPKKMSRRIATNISSEHSLIVRLMPLFIKNMVMKAVFNAVGERKSCLSMSNLGAIQLPECMLPYVERMDFILGPQATKPNNCGVLSFKGMLYINFIRNVRQSGLEYHFFRVLQEQGLPVTVESNHPQH